MCKACKINNCKQEQLRKRIKYLENDYMAIVVGAIIFSLLTAFFTYFLSLLLIPLSIWFVESRDYEKMAREQLGLEKGDEK